MNHFQLYRLALLLFLNHSIQCRKICDFTDAECVTRGANHFYKSFVGGIEPIHEDNIEGEILTLRYKLTNITLTGFKNCDVTKLLCIPEDMSFDFFLRCSQLILKSMYEVNGTLLDTQIDGQGSLLITSDDYIIRIQGTYGKLLNDKDQKLYMFVKTFEIETDPEGKITIDTKRLIGDAEKSELAKRFLNDNAREMEKLFRVPALNKLFTNFGHKYSELLKSHPIEEIIPANDVNN